MRFILASLLVFTLNSALATNLPVEHESVRLLLAAEKSISESAWTNAEQQLAALEALNLDLPIKYYYFKGIVLNQSGQLPEAQNKLEEYVIKGGADGEYYTQALEMITEIDSVRGKQSIPQDKNEAPEISLSGDGYIKSLQALFLTDDPLKALILHANSLLTAHPFTGSRIKKQSNENGIVYRLSISGQDLVVQEKRFTDGQPSLKVNKLNTSGIDPFVRYGCDFEEHACWVYDPTDQYKRWIQIDRDELVVQELTKALTKLIAGMQK